MPRVLVDGRPLSAASATRGIGTYVRAVLPRLACAPGLELVALATEGTPLPDGVSRVRVRRFSPSRFNFHEQLALLPFDIRRARSDVFLGIGTDPPRACPVPWVHVLFDVIPLSFAHPDFAAERRRWRLRGRNLRHADVIVVPSQHTEEQVVDRLGLDPARLRLVHPGVDPAFVPPAARPERSAPYVLYVSEYGPHKGFREAFELIARLADAGLPHRLVMVGHMSPRARHLVHTIMRQSPHPERVELVGRVPLPRLVELYQQASLLAVTSRYEGFGLPAVEAMASGTPVVAFDNSSLPEILGDAGVLVPDGFVEAFAEATIALLRDGPRWSAQAAAGIARARAFGWDQCAAGLADIVREVAA